MIDFPLKFREIATDRFVFANDAGDQFFGDEKFLDRYATENLTNRDWGFLNENGLAATDLKSFNGVSFLRRYALRMAQAQTTNYLILVPTLRCDLACSYCQVSRVNKKAQGYDWNDETLSHVLRYLDGLETKRIKIEFQGGEPTLRVDLLERIAGHCRKQFDSCEFIVCTNLQDLRPDVLGFLDHEDVFVSTSLDGDWTAHQEHRTKSKGRTEEFFNNIQKLVDRSPKGKVSALPTIDPTGDANLEDLISAYSSLGLNSIYLRPVNYQGFARKTFSSSRDAFESWNKLYFSFIDTLIERANENSELMVEFYFTLCLKRFLHAGEDHHVDLRNPNYFGKDYLVIDYDGAFYPTDESRMLTRIGQVDLSVGHVTKGLDFSKLEQLNESAINSFHEECIHCPYQSCCGIDLVDDLSRYGRTDIIKSESWFCKRHLAIFDRIASDLSSDSPKARIAYAKWLGVPKGTIERGLGAP